MRNSGWKKKKKKSSDSLKIEDLVSHFESILEVKKQ